MAMAPEAALDHARALLDKIPLVDGHNDLPWVIREQADRPGDVAAARLGEDLPKRDSDIPKMRAGGLTAQFWAAFLPTATPHSLRSYVEQIALIARMEALHPDVFLPGRRASDIARAKAEGKIASFTAVEGGVALEGSLEVLSTFYALGARYMTLCHNETLDWVDSTTDEKRHGGLTDFGRRVIAEMNRLGMIVDCSHTSHDTMRQVLGLSKAPVAFTHCNAFSLCAHPRNVPDDVLAALPANGGIVMATFVPDFVSEASRTWMSPVKDAYGKTLPEVDWAAFMPARRAELGPWPRGTVAELATHIEYMADKAGIAHVGIGSDFFGGPTPQGLEDESRFPYLIAELVGRGWSDDALAGLMSGNFVRVFEAVEAVAARLADEAPALGRVGEDRDRNP